MTCCMDCSEKRTRERPSSAGGELTKPPGGQCAIARPRRYQGRARDYDCRPAGGALVALQAELYGLRLPWIDHEEPTLAAWDEQASATQRVSPPVVAVIELLEQPTEIGRAQALSAGISIPIEPVAVVGEARIARSRVTVRDESDRSLSTVECQTAALERRQDGDRPILTHAALEEDRRGCRMRPLDPPTRPFIKRDLYLTLLEDFAAARVYDKEGASALAVDPRGEQQPEERRVRGEVAGDPGRSLGQRRRIGKNPTRVPLLVEHSKHVRPGQRQKVLFLAEGHGLRQAGLRGLDSSSLAEARVDDDHKGAAIGADEN